MYTHKDIMWSNYNYIFVFVCRVVWYDDAMWSYYDLINAGFTYSLLPTTVLEKYILLFLFLQVDIWASNWTITLLLTKIYKFAISRLSKQTGHYTNTIHSNVTNEYIISLKLSH